MSQFTLLASTKKGSKPDFHGAMGGDEAKRLYDYFYRRVQEGYAADKVKNGVFQAMMQVALVNDGPVRPHPYSVDLVSPWDADIAKGHPRTFNGPEAGEGSKEEGSRRVTRMKNRQILANIKQLVHQSCDNLGQPGHGNNLSFG